MNKIYKTLLTLFLCFTLALANATPIMTVLADEVEKSKYTDVLTDLTLDETFNTGDYPSITDMSNKAYGSISVIQVAESIDDELFIYTYQPSESAVQFTATSILMWDSYNDKGFDEKVIQEFHPIVYELELLSKSGVFAKYLVKDYTVSDEGYRYYNIATIWRPYNSSVDGATSADTSEKGFEVGQQWLMYTFNDVYYCEMVTFETLEIDITCSGYLRFWDGISFGSIITSSKIYGTSHIIGFNAENYIIEHIYDADLSFRTRAAYEGVSKDGGTLTVGSGYYDDDWSALKTVTLTADQKQTFENKGLFGTTVKWDRISKGELFVENMDKQDVVWEDGVKTKLKNSQWVFAFYESEFVEENRFFGGVTYPSYDYTAVGDVSVLRVHFMDVTGDVYNLAVVGGKVNANELLGTVGDIDLSFLEDGFQWLILMLGIIAIICIVGFCTPLLTSLGAMLVNVISAVFDVVISILAVPFELIGNLFGSGGKKKK